MNIEQRAVIIKYIKSDIISDSDRKFLLRYLATTTMSDEDENSVLSCIDILSDIGRLGNDIEQANDTSLIRERAMKISELTSRVAKVLETGNNDELVDISYELDRLYEVSGLEPRRTNTAYLKASKELCKINTREY